MKVEAYDKHWNDPQVLTEYTFATTAGESITVKMADNQDRAALEKARELAGEKVYPVNL